MLLVATRLYRNEVYRELKEKYQYLFDPLIPLERKKVDTLIDFLGQDKIILPAIRREATSVTAAIEIPEMVY